MLALRSAAPLFATGSVSRCTVARTASARWGSIRWSWIFAATFFAGVLLATGIATSPLGALTMIGVSTLTGLAFAAPITAFSVTQKTDQGFAFIFRLIITPLTFFSGTYFPIENLPGPAQAIAWLTPLAHGVALDRAFALDRPLPDAWVHVAVLLAWAIGGTMVASVLFRRRMLK